MLALRAGAGGRGLALGGGGGGGARLGALVRGVFVVDERGGEHPVVFLVALEISRVERRRADGVASGGVGKGGRGVAVLGA